MYTATPSGYGVDVQLYHLSIRIEFGQQIESFGICRLVTKLRRYDRAVDHELVDVARRKVRVVAIELAFSRIQRWRHGMDLQLSTIGIRGIFQNIQMSTGDLVIV